MNFPRFLRFLHATYLTSSIHIPPHHDPQLDISSFRNSTLELRFHTYSRARPFNSTTVGTLVLLAQCHPHGFELLQLKACNNHSTSGGVYILRHSRKRTTYAGFLSKKI